MSKKAHKQKKFFSVTNKNLNWEIITKNLVTFKLLKNFNITRIH